MIAEIPGTQTWADRGGPKCIFAVQELHTVEWHVLSICVLCTCVLHVCCASNVLRHFHAFVKIRTFHETRCLWSVFKFLWFDLVTEFSIHTSQPLKILIIKNMCNVRTFLTHIYEICFVRIYVTYENVLWPNLYYTQKYDILYVHFFLQMRML